MVLLNPSCLKEVIMNKENKKVVAAVTGTTAIIKKMLGHKISQAKIVETLMPMFTEKGISESLAKRRIRPLIYRELKRKGK